jgi:hypothetical protein
VLNRCVVAPSIYVHIGDRPRGRRALPRSSVARPLAVTFLVIRLSSKIS